MNKHPMLEWCEAGYAVFPVTEGGKAPLVPGGVKSATKNVEQVKAWLEAWPSCNWGLAAGANNLVFLDFDVKHNGLVTLAELEGKHADAFNTLHILTGGGGAHFYYLAPTTWKMKQGAGLLPGFDTRVGNGYVLGPGSVTDGEYEVLSDTSDIVPFPEALRYLVEDKKPESVLQQWTEPTDKGELNKRTLKFVAAGAAPGQWHQEYYQAAMDCLQNGYSFDEAKELLTKATGELDETHDIPQLLDVYTNRTPKYQANVDLSTETSEVLAPSLVWASSLAGEMFSYLTNKELVKGEPTGIAGLDALLGGGKRLGELTVTLAEAKSGKNTLWHKMMYHWLKQGRKLAYASRELSPETEVLPNLLSLHYRKNYWLATDYDQADAASVVARWPLVFSPGYGQFDEELFGWMDLCRGEGIEWFWIDHLHYLLSDPEEFKEISKLIRQLKSYAKQHKVHIDLIVQPKIQETGTRLSLNSLRGGASIGQALDNLITMTRERDTTTGRKIDVSKIELEVARSKLAKLGCIYLQYDRTTTDFTEVEVAGPEEQEEMPRISDDIPVADRGRLSQYQSKRLDG